MKRRDFLKYTTFAAAALLTPKISSLLAEDTPRTGLPDVVWVENGEPAELLKVALQEIGGLKRFIKSGDTVVIKPNIGWDRSPEQGATTNPDLVGELVKSCLEAGAKKVRIFDFTCNNPQRCYHNSGIQAKAEAAGAEVVHIDESRFKTIPLKGGKLLKEWPVYLDYLEADKVINVPIAKHHGLAGVTLGIKNLMGVMGGNRGEIHSPFSKLIDIAAEILPTLTIIDGYRLLTKHGPSGGNVKDVVSPRTLIVSPCTLAADVTALKLFPHELSDIPHLQEAVQRNLNRVDLKNLQLVKKTLS